MEHTPEPSTIVFPGTDDPASPWRLYNHLIAGIPEGIFVRDYCLGLNWSYVEADCGCGVAFTARNGEKRTYKGDLRGKSLREVAELSKSWCFEEATLGIAALNAWYARRELLDPLGATYDTEEEVDKGKRGGTSSKDAFETYRPRIEQAGGDAHVVVVGHFPHVENIAEYAFITGVTLINKTAPRLLTLAKDATVCMVGPSVIMTPHLFEWGVESLSGSVVADPEAVKFACKNAAGKLFGKALQMTTINAQ